MGANPERSGSILGLENSKVALEPTLTNNASTGLDQHCSKQAEDDPSRHRKLLSISFFVAQRRKVARKAGSSRSARPALKLERGPVDGPVGPTRIGILSPALAVELLGVFADDGDLRDREKGAGVSRLLPDAHECARVNSRPCPP